MEMERVKREADRLRREALKQQRDEAERIKVSERNGLVAAPQQGLIVRNSVRRPRRLKLNAVPRKMRSVNARSKRNARPRRSANRLRASGARPSNARLRPSSSRNAARRPSG